MTIAPFWYVSKRLFVIVAVPDVGVAWRPTLIAIRSGSRGDRGRQRISVNWLSSTVTDPPPATNRPARVSVEQNSVRQRPAITKPSIVQPVAPLIRMMSPGSAIDAGALIVAAATSSTSM